MCIRYDMVASIKDSIVKMREILLDCLFVCLYITFAYTFIYTLECNSSGCIVMCIYVVQFTKVFHA